MDNLEDPLEVRALNFFCFSNTGFISTAHNITQIFKWPIYCVQH